MQSDSFTSESSNKKGSSSEENQAIKIQEDYATSEKQDLRVVKQTRSQNYH